MEGRTRSPPIVAHRAHAEEPKRGGRQRPGGAEAGHAHPHSHGHGGRRKPEPPFAFFFNQCVMCAGFSRISLEELLFGGVGTSKSAPHKGQPCRLLKDIVSFPLLVLEGIYH